MIPAMDAACPDALELTLKPGQSETGRASDLELDLAIVDMLMAGQQLLNVLETYARKTRHVAQAAEAARAKRAWESSCRALATAIDAELVS